MNDEIAHKRFSSRCAFARIVPILTSFLRSVLNNFSNKYKWKKEKRFVLSSFFHFVWETKLKRFCESDENESEKKNSDNFVEKFPFRLNFEK